MHTAFGNVAGTGDVMFILGYLFVFDVTNLSNIWKTTSLKVASMEGVQTN